jgi:hypothetical protein
MKKHLGITNWLISDCANKVCYGCDQTVNQAPSLRWYITMGHPGFNSPANNRNGYKTKQSALSASKKYGMK